MKFPGKRLIIEYKNRRARKNVKSLWGDINIKEIARAVDDDTTMPAAQKSELPAAQLPEAARPADKTNNTPTNKVTGKVTGDQPAAARTSGRILSTVQEPNSDAARQVQHPTQSKQAPVLQRPKASQNPKGSEPSNKPTEPTPSPETLKPFALEPSQAAADAPTSAPVATKHEGRARKALVEPSILQQAAAVAQTPSHGSGPAPAPSHEGRATQPAATSLPRRMKPARAGKLPAATHLHSSKPQPAPRSNAPDRLFYHRPAPGPDDLAALESENNHLKQLLAKKLRAENTRLEKMIVRAISPIDKA
ncbi:hypothetical protein Brsp05_04474 [Brucella sp. NBRC 12953]|uniref:hypothetical protein n=1 Tax=Brucella sp. NBRC 12953 TaxID=3075481 RepID=UPI0030B1FF01